MYTVDANGVITRVGDGFIVPRDIHDTAYQEYLYWQSNGILPNVPATAVTPAEITAAIAINDATQ